MTSQKSLVLLLCIMIAIVLFIYGYLAIFSQKKLIEFYINKTPSLTYKEYLKVSSEKPHVKIRIRIVGVVCIIFAALILFVSMLKLLNP